MITILKRDRETLDMYYIYIYNIYVRVYIYIHTYLRVFYLFAYFCCMFVCLCVCVCVCLSLSLSPPLALSMIYEFMTMYACWIVGQLKGAALVAAGWRSWT